MEKKISFSEILKKYTMVLVLVLVVIMFAVNTKGVMLLPQNVNNLVAQNAYVFILATGMLFCILTGGNIDLSVGSVVCFVAAVGGKMMVLNSMNPYLTMLVADRYCHRCMAGILDCICKNPTVYCNSGWYACVPWSFKRSFTGTDTGTNA